MELLSQRAQYANGGIGTWYWDYRDRQVLSFINEEKDILDLGCGEGITLAKLVYEFPDRNIFGIDLEERNVSICRSYHLPAFQGDVYSLNLKDRFFDCCLFLEVIEHLQEPFKALAEIHRLLKPGGLLLLLFPHDSLFKLARLACFKFKEAFADSGHVKKWSPWEMSLELGLAGFTVEKMVFMPFGIWPFSLHCLMVARKNG